MKADIPNRTYYKIGEVASILGVKPHIVRYWAEEFPQIRLKKTKSGQRLFTRRDIDLLLAIERLVIGQEYTVSGAKSRLQLLKDIGVEHERLHEMIDRLQDDVLIARIVQEQNGVQESLNFGGGAPQDHSASSTEPSASPENTAALEDANQELDEAKQALKEAYQSLENTTAEHAALQRELGIEFERKEAVLRNENSVLRAELQKVQAALEAERAVQKRRQDLSRKSLEEERQFYADEQHILTLYIEELEESLYQAQEKARTFEDASHAQRAQLASAQAKIRSYAMQKRYALRKASDGAKQRQQQAHAHLRVLVERLQHHARAHRQDFGQSARHDSD